MIGVNEKWFEDNIQDGEDGTEHSWETYNLYWAYRNSKERGYKFLVLEELPWNGDDGEIGKAMENAQVEWFVITCHSTALMGMLHRYKGMGYAVYDTVEISQESKPYYRPEWDKPLKGLLMKK